MTPEQQALIAAEVARYGNTSETIKQRVETALRALWGSFDAWYNRREVDDIARQAASISLAGQQAAAGASRQYGAIVVSYMTDRELPQPRVSLPQVRAGAPLSLVHTRAAERYKRAIARGESAERALEIALGYGGGLGVSDVTLAEREMQRRVMEALGVQQYRRVLRPELSRTGSCGLCIAAADRVYTVGELMPIHPPSCKCITLPIVGENDPGLSLNDEDLKQLYADAGSNKAADLRRTRYQVNEHGEFGPVLSKVSDAFRGPDKVALEDDPERAARMLAQLLPVLERLEAAGGPAGPLEYQREQVARLTAITGAAAAA